MTPVKDLIRKIRVMIHDTEKLNYSDKDMVDVLNDALRFIRRTISEIQPELLMSTTRGILKPGEDTIELKNIPLKIIKLSAGDEVISIVDEIPKTIDIEPDEKIFGNDNKIFSRDTYTIESRNFFRSPYLDFKAYGTGGRCILQSIIADVAEV